MADIVKYIIVSPRGNYIALRDFYNFLAVVKDDDEQFLISMTADMEEYQITGFGDDEDKAKQAVNFIHETMLEHSMTFEPIIIDLGKDLTLNDDEEGD